MLYTTIGNIPGVCVRLIVSDGIYIYFIYHIFTIGLNIQYQRYITIGNISYAGYVCDHMTLHLILYLLTMAFRYTVHSIFRD